MVIIEFDSLFEKKFKRIKNKLFKEKIKKQLLKIRNNPEIGKPMKFTRKGTREVYVSPYRLSYVYFEEKQTIIILDLYHKDEQ